MQSPNTLENPNRRPYHLVVGTMICIVIYTIVVIGVRIVMS